MMNKKILIGFVIALIFTLNIYNMPLKKETKVTEDPIKAETNLRKIDLKKFNQVVNQSMNSTIDFDDYDVVVATFWATWCPSCKKENVIFNELLTRKTKYKYFIVGICVDQQKSALATYLKGNQLNYPVYNNNKETAELFDNINAVPTHYIINVKSQTMQKRLGLIVEQDIIDLSITI